ncbi:phospho-N-acetylmuramoyl-pentapeptide-transferase [candidate division CSSED10-310 bacterium]|uniref:Phospho-N-acetylmuramoyl-pentapeptide-transferase n=1 Tax=candidate division CSSED10-310 bacterium TaxID=2855610 RepID=A0ABV6YUZ6_UNCC1
MFYYFFYSLHKIHTVFQVFRYITFRTALATVTGLLICLILGPWLTKKLASFQIQEKIRDDGPAGHKTKAGTPTMGGILIIIGTVIPTLLWADIGQRYIVITILAMVSFGVLGFVDDYLKIQWQGAGKKGMSGRSKLFWQGLIALCIGITLYTWDPDPAVSHLSFPFFKNFYPDLEWFYLGIIFLVIVGASNAVNLTDGLDGLAIGNIVIVFVSFMILSYLSGNIRLSEYLLIPYIRGAGELSVFCGALIGSGLGFLWFNCYPAQVFLGDVGALSLGGVLGTIALITKQELLLILIGGIFVAEAVSVIIQVGSFQLTGQRVFRMTPLHHHFELLGWHEVKITVRFMIIALILNLLGLATLKIR